MAKKTAARRAAAPVRAAVRLLTPVQDLIRTESASGVVLIAAAVVAFAWANSPWSAAYFAILDLPMGFGAGGWGLGKPLLLWVNDLLMAIFFFLVGLEIKREVLVGELAGWRRAALPIAGAVGGMLVPAVIYAGLNLGAPSLRGWGVPMATDIAFALGVLALLGERVILPLKVFLLALAIVDDLGAVLVIALFYTADLDLAKLVLALVVWGVVLAYGRFGAARPLVFAVIGAAMWYLMLKSGVHATVAGVLMALAVPLRHGLTPEQLQQELRRLSAQGGGFEQVEVVTRHLEGVLARAHSPLHAMEHALAPYVAFLIMPVFAFCNAGVAVGGAGGMLGPVTLGASLGLLVGKPVGVAGFAWLAVRSGLARLPEGATWSGVLGIGVLAGIGFTMSLFIANLAFGAGAELDQAKLGVLGASVIAALAGLALLTQVLPPPRRRPAAPADAKEAQGA